MAAKNLPGAMGPEYEPAAPGRQTKLTVGLVSTCRSGLLEVRAQLAHDSVGLSRAISVSDNDLGRERGGRGMLAALSALESDPETEVIVLIGAEAEPTVTHKVLDRVRDSDMPTVVCLLGTERRLAWRAGAIPASRLDEAAMRAAAWVLNWDQALISTRLEQQDEELKARAQDLRPKIGSGRHKVLGLLSSRLFCLEAQLMLAELIGSEAASVFQNLSGLTGGGSPEARDPDREQGTAWSEALRRPDTAIVLADVGFGGLSGPDPESAYLVKGLRGSILIAHASAESPLGQSKEIGDPLETAGIILAPSNAAAARLAAFCLAD